MDSPTSEPDMDASLLAPDTGKPLTKVAFYRFAIGFIIFGSLWMMSMMIGSAVLLPQHFADIFPGHGEAALGTMNSFGSIFALIANIVFGALSDATRSRFGKRTPWIVCGGLVSGIAFWVTSIQTTIPGIAISWSVLQIGLNMMIAPALPILSDRVPLRRRATISAFYGGGNIFGQSLGTIIGTRFITQIPSGILFGTISWILTGVLVVLIWPRERSAALAAGETKPRVTLRSLLLSFIPAHRTCHDFYLALMGRFLFIFGYFAISGYQFYILERYVGLGEMRASDVLAIMSLIIMIVSLVSSLSSGALSDRIGRRKPFVVGASVMIVIGMAVPWLFPSIGSMYAYAALAGFGFGMYGAVDQALNVDVLPDRDTAGKDLGIMNIANTAGQALAPVATSSIVLITSSYFLTFPCAIAFTLLGVLFIMLIKTVR